ncbi:helix-turn-helix domain-containing protein [Fodinicola feengrottensis]|uniref:Helix-turn-helix domain-containing protein n=1 Tax=Fodinicola feengrottensis TaxID=435914 RepID=A0ABN2FXH8_9ACTN
MNTPGKPTPTEHAGAHSLTLERGLRVLKTLGDHPDGLSVSQLAQTLQTHRAGIYRLLGPLVEQRLVIRLENGRYVLGPGLIELASRVRSRLREVTVPILQRLADGLRATTALTLRDGDEAVVAAVLQPRSTDLHIAYRTGLRHPITVAASGIALLSGRPARPGERDTVTQARKAGYAISHGELLAGASGVGAPIQLPGREVDASISAVWVDDRDPHLAGREIVKAARQITYELG